MGILCFLLFAMTSAPDPHRVSDMKYISSVYDALPTYEQVEMDARYEQPEINQVLADLDALDYLGDDLHAQTEKLKQDVGALEARDTILTTQDLI